MARLSPHSWTKMYCNWIAWWCPLGQRRLAKVDRSGPPHFRRRADSASIERQVARHGIGRGRVSRLHTASQASGILSRIARRTIRGWVCPFRSGAGVAPARDESHCLFYKIAAVDVWSVICVVATDSDYASDEVVFVVECLEGSKSVKNLSPPAAHALRCEHQRARLSRTTIGMSSSTSRSDIMGP